MFFWVNGASGAVKSRLACATAGVVALAWKCFRIARAVELMVQGVFFFSLMTLCYCVLHMLKHFLHWNCCVQRMCSRVVRRHSIVLCNSVSADRSGMAASSFIVAAAACIILVPFAAESRKFHIFTFWELKEASHESCVFTHHGCDLNVRICTNIVFFPVNGASGAVNRSWMRSTKKYWDVLCGSFACSTK